MKRILFYGDSNTWGYDFDHDTRFNVHLTWPMLLAEQLAAQKVIIEPMIAGLNGRMTNIDDPTWPGRNASKTLATSLEENDPLDLIIICLGANDLKTRLKRRASDIFVGLGELVGIVRTDSWSHTKQQPSIVVVSPMPIMNEHAFDDEFIGAKQLYAELIDYLNNNSLGDNVMTIDVSQQSFGYCKDGVHLNQAGHLQLAQLLAPAIQPILA